MIGSLSLPRVLLAYFLLHTRIAAPFLLHAAFSHRTGSGVCLRVYLCDMSSQTVTMQDLPAMAALALPELTRPSVRVFGAMVPLMLFHASSREVPTAELTLSILGGRRFHFPMSSDSAPAHRCKPLIYKELETPTSCRWWCGKRSSQRHSHIMTPCKVHSAAAQPTVV